VLARLPGQRRRQRRVDLRGDLLGSGRRLRRIGRRHPRRLFEPGQCRAPRRAGGVAVLGGDPRQVMAVGRHRGEGGVVAAVGVKREQFLHHDRHRPAVEQDVMMGEHEPVPVGGEADQAGAQQRWRRHVEARAAVLRQERRETRVALGGGKPR
jgi:hypothetical protein